MLEVKHYVGLDLGQVSDHTALVALRREQEILELPKPKVVSRQEMDAEPVSGQKDRERLGERSEPSRYYCNVAERFELGTPYTTLVERVAKLFVDQRFAGQTLVVDGTGVGRAVVDLFRKAKINCRLMPVTITSGAVLAALGYTRIDDFGYWHVPKKELVSSVQVLLGTGRMKIAPSLKYASALIQELKNFSYKISSATAHVSLECLIGGTLIETREGAVPIEFVEKGQDVLTRFGYHKVIWSGETKKVLTTCRVQFADGQSLEGTPDHLVWTINRGWVHLGRLTCQDYCAQVLPRLGLRSSTGSSTGTIIDTTTMSLLSMVFNGSYIGMYGYITTALFHGGTTSTTRTGIGTTMMSPTLNVCRTPTMRKGTIRSKLVRLKSVLRAVRNSLVFRAVGRGSVRASTVKEISTAQGGAFTTGRGNDASFSASTVVKSSRRLERTPWYIFAPVNVKELINICTESARPELVGVAERPSWRAIERSNIVRVVVPPVIVKHCVPVSVYDLIVDTNHEFYANGILAHNSWREKDHDDLVLGLALAAWAGEQRKEFWIR